MKSIHNKVVALTGASSGIGRALAIQLAQQGCQLALSDIDEAGLKETINQLPAGTNAITEIVNVAVNEEVLAWAKNTVDHFGHVDVIINNAGVAAVGSVEDMSLEDFNWVFNIVFYGVLYGTKAFLPYLQKRPEAHIVNISSVNGFFPFPNNSPYNCAKHAVKALNQTLAQELYDSKVNITSVHPGGIQTNIANSSRLASKTFNSNDHKDFKANFNSIAATTPETAAKVIIKGMLKNKKRVLVGLDAYILDILCRLMPQGLSTIVGMTTRWQLRQTAKHNNKKITKEASS